jgi:cold shock CspA family protein
VGVATVRTGTVESIDIEAGTGTVMSAAGESAFFYASALAGLGLAFSAELVGASVRFDIQRTNRGLRARNVRPV